MSSAEKNKAVRAYEDFHEEPHEGGRKIDIPTAQGVVWELGKVLAISYEAKIDGKMIRYEHWFKRTSAPHIAVSADGKSMFFAGGNYRVTERGITDI